MPEGLPLGRDRAKTVSGWLGAACVLGVCTCLLPVRALAQADAPGNASPSPASSTKTADSKTANPTPANPRRHAKSAAAGSKTSSTSAAKAHAAASTHTKSKTSATAHKSRWTQSRKNTAKRTRGQQKIDPERAQAIQEALIREHYLTGEPAGTWNQASEDALRRYQADHGWQSKTVPDSRALISLGLGPNHDHLLNPESAMTTEPNASHAATANSPSQIPVSHSDDPGARPATNRAVPADPGPPTSSGHDPSSPQ